MKVRREIQVYWSEEDDRFLAEVPELPKLIADGATRIGAMRDAGEVIDAFLKTAREAGWSVSEPGGRLAFV